MSNSEAERASSSSSSGSTFSLISLTTASTLTPLLFAGPVELDLLRLAGAHADELLLELGDEPAGTELDDVVTLTTTVVGDEVEDDRVPELGGTVFDRRELRHGRAQDVQLVVDEILRNLRFRIRNFELLPVRDVRLRQDGDRGREPPVLVL